MNAGVRARIPHEKVGDGFLAYLWVVRGYKLHSAYTFVTASKGLAADYAKKHREEFEAFNPTPEPADPDFDLFSFLPYVDARRGMVKLSALLRWYGDVVRVDRLKNDFFWWCYAQGLDPADFLHRGGRKTGYWVPWDFVEWWRKTLLPQYQSRLTIEVPIWG